MKVENEYSSLWILLKYGESFKTAIGAVVSGNVHIGIKFQWAITSNMKPLKFQPPEIMRTFKQ